MGDITEQHIGAIVGEQTSDGMALAGMLVELDEERRALKARLEQVNENMGQIKSKLLDVFERYGVNSLHVNGMTVYLSQQISAKLVGDRRQAVIAVKAWAPDCVKEDFNLNTISALMREGMRKGGFTDPKDLVAELPEDIRAMFDVVDWYDVRIRKA